MGTINFKTSKYITMAHETKTGLDLFNDSNWYEEERQYLLDHGTDEEDIEDELADRAEAYAAFYEEQDFLTVQNELKEHSFVYFDITLQGGYYDGFQLLIDDSCTVWDEEDRKDALEEVEEIRSFLHTCNDFGMRACSPHWCTGWKDFNETADAIEDACNAMRKEVEELALEEA